MSTHNKFLLSALSAAVIGLGAVQTASAGALAESIIQVNNFVISHTNGNAVDVNEFDYLSFQSNADVSADLDSIADSTIDSELVNNQFNAPIDLLAIEGTNPGYVDNSFVPLSSTAGYPIGNFAIGDSLESGAPIVTYIDTNDDGVADTPVAAGADLGNAAYVSIERTDDGSATSNNGLIVDFSFSGISGSLDFTYDLDLYAETFIDLGGIDAQAQVTYQVTWSLTEVDCTPSISGGCTNLLTDMTGVAGVDFTNISGSFSSSVPGTGNASILDYDLAGIVLRSSDLDAAKEYHINATILATADAKAVPEPNVLALLGFGLVGLGALRRRKA